MAAPLPNASDVRRRRVLREEVADVVRSNILLGRLPRGSRLDILDIAGEMGISQLPVREALIALSAEGLVRNEARRGYYVEELDPIDMLDHYEIYGKIAGIAAARLATTITEDELAALTDINERMRRAVDPDEQERFNQDFHRLINRTGGSRRLKSVMRSLSRGMDVHFAALIPTWLAHSAQEHDEILAALRARDVEAARAAMERHLSVNGHKAVDALERVGFFDTDETST